MTSAANGVCIEIGPSLSCPQTEPLVSQTGLHTQVVSPNRPVSFGGQASQPPLANCFVGLHFLGATMNRPIPLLDHRDRQCCNSANPAGTLNGTF
jgi:hypothetical protein